MYGEAGRDSKRISSNSLLFDLQFLELLSDQTYIDEINQHIHKFVILLNEQKEKGTTTFYLSPFTFHLVNPLTYL